MTKSEIVRLLFEQSPFLAFSAEDLQKIDQRYRSKRSVYARFGYQWKDAHGHAQKALSLALKKTLKGFFKDIRSSSSRQAEYKLNYASLRAQAGKPVLHRIVLDILSADLLFFDLTYLNPNVLLEIGIAYATNENLFLLSDERSKSPPPSDLAGLTYCKYSVEKTSFLNSFAERDIKSAMRKVLVRKMRLNSRK
jgi:hypothetical protein